MNNTSSVKRSGDRFLIIIPDIDDDVGRKANLNTPILGYKNCTDAAIKLGTSDPGDTDINAIFGGLKLYNSLKNKHNNVEISIISGSENVSSEECANKIKEQLDFLIYLYEPNFVYIVSDGKEDELIINYIRNKDIFVWKNRVVVKQNESLESTYYILQEFLQKTMSKYVPLIFTAIGFSLLMYSILADLGWRIVAGLVGIYIIAEGSGFLDALRKSIKEGKRKFEFGNITPIGDATAWIIILLGGIYAYLKSYTLELTHAIGNFIMLIVDPLTLGLLVSTLIHLIDDILNTDKDMLVLIKSFFFKIIIIIMLRSLLILMSNYIEGNVPFTTVGAYVIGYVALLTILSAILFYNTKSAKK